MQKVILIAVLAIGTALPAQVLQFADLNIRDFAKLDRSKTAVIIPGAILEEHGPYLPSGTDGIFNAKLSADLATAIASRPRRADPRLATNTPPFAPAHPPNQ